MDPSPRCSFVALKKSLHKEMRKKLQLDIGLYNHTWTSAIFQKSCTVLVPCPQPFPTFFDFFGSVSSLLRLHTWRIPGYPSTTSRACRVSLSAVGNCILGPMGFMGSNSRITGTRTHESEIKGTDFHGQWPTSNGLSLCVFFYLDEVTLLF